MPFQLWNPKFDILNNTNLTPNAMFLYDSGMSGSNGNTGTYRPVTPVDFGPTVANFGGLNNLNPISGSSLVLDNALGFMSIAFGLTVPLSGEVTFETTFDGLNWNKSTMRRMTNDGYVQKSSIPYDSYIGSIAGARQFRVRTSLSGFQSGHFGGTMQRGVSSLEGIEVGPPSDFETNIIEGKVAGYSVINKFGRNSGVLTSSLPVDCWNGNTIYPGFPTGAAQVVRVMSNHSSDHTTGIGARTVSLVGLDSNFLNQTDVMNLSGLSPVTGSKLWTRIHSATIRTAGSQEANMGNITVSQTPNTGARFVFMPVGTNQSYVLAYTVPADKTAYLRHVYASLNRGAGGGAVQDRECDIAIATRNFGEIFRLRRPTSLNNNAPLDYEIFGGLVFPAKTDIVMRITNVSTDNSDVSAGFDLVISDN